MARTDTIGVYNVSFPRDFGTVGYTYHLYCTRSFSYAVTSVNFRKCPSGESGWWAS